MPSRDLAYVLDVLNAARAVQSFMTGVDKATFEQDLMRQSAVVRQIEVMGEATKRISAPFRNGHPDIPWRQIAGMRDILIHAYDRVEVDEVWTTVQDSIPRPSYLSLSHVILSDSEGSLRRYTQKPGQGL